MNFITTSKTCLFLFILFSGKLFGQINLNVTGEDLLRMGEQSQRASQHIRHAREINNQNLLYYHAEILAETNRDQPNQERLRELRNQHAMFEREERGYAAGDESLRNGFNLLTNTMAGEMQSNQRIREIWRAGQVKNIGARQQLGDIITFLKDPKNILLLGLATLAAVGAYYGVKFTYEYAKAKVGKPDLVRESSRKTLLSQFKKFLIEMFSEELRPKFDLEDVILAPEIEAHVHILAEDIIQTRNYGLPYQNIILEGPPGTGKTMLARILAERTGGLASHAHMDYAILSGADFRQFTNGEDITKLHELFAWAKNSDNGLIIFIDEADALLPSREDQKLDSQRIELINAFISETGEGSDKFMLILATNYAEKLDAAVRSRIHKKIHMGLPALAERIRIIDNKIEKYILSDSRTYIRDNEEITASLTLDETINDEYINAIATMIDGFSGRDIEQMIAEIRLRGYRSGENKVTKEIFEAVLADKKKTVDQDKKITAYQKEQLNKTARAVPAA